MAAVRARFAVLVLTARDDWTSKVEGFKAGADDYLVKPVRVEEVIMRLRARAGQARGRPRQSGDRLRAGELQRADRHLHLRRIAAEADGAGMACLSTLILRKGVVVQRGELFERVYEAMP